MVVIEPLDKRLIPNRDSGPKGCVAIPELFQLDFTDTGVFCFYPQCKCIFPR
jgi:hypothetical protein